MPPREDEDNLFPTQSEDENEDRLFAAHSPSQDDLFPATRSTKDNLFAAAEVTEEEIEMIDQFADARDLNPMEKVRLIAQYRESLAIHRKPLVKDDDSLW
ncbi:MAG TPA: hypothetical protein V6D50_00605 [Chroococcales cyanobacterium]|jgi:hypothetical protein